MSDRLIASIKDMGKVSIAKVEMLDFSYIRHKALNTLGWKSGALEIMESQYRDFLAFRYSTKLLGYNIEIVPNRAIDEFWHMHILDTKKYREDCKFLFNEEFDHFPYFGIMGDVDGDNWKKTSIISNEIWKGVFGYELYADEIDNEVDSYELDKKQNFLLSEIIERNSRAAARCRVQCKPQKCK